MLQSSGSQRVRHDLATGQQLYIYDMYEKLTRDFSGDPAVKNLPSNSGDVDSTPRQATKIPLAVWQLSPRAATKTQRYQIIR